MARWSPPPYPEHETSWTARYDARAMDRQAGSTVEVVEDPIYWAAYVCKHVNLAGSLTDRKLFASTVVTRGMARDRWNRFRAILPCGQP